MKRLLLLCALLLALLAGCASLRHVPPESLSADEQIRLAIENQQDEMKELLHIGSAYVNEHKEKNPQWKAEVLPLCKEANQLIGQLIADARKGMIFFPVSYSRANKKLRDIRKILIQWGAL
jgi:hypothetical protein